MAIGLLIVMLISATVGGALTTYSVNHWLAWAGKPQSFHYWHGFLICLIPHIGGLSIGAAIITFFLSFFFTI